MPNEKKVRLRPVEAGDLSDQRGFFLNPDLAGLDCHYPHQFASLDLEKLLLPEKYDPKQQATFGIDADGKYIGYCGLWNLDSAHNSYELGINIGDPEFWDQGFGQETVKLLLNYAFHYLPGRRIELTTHGENERAIRCYTGCGFIEEGRLREAAWIEGRFLDLVIMSLLKRHWKA